MLGLSLALVPGAAHGQPAARALDAWAYATVIVACAALVARRRWPLAVAGVAGAALVVFAAGTIPAVRSSRRSW